MMQACLCPPHIKLILTAIKRVREGQSLTLKQFQRLLGGSCVQCDTLWPVVYEAGAKAQGMEAPARGSSV